MKKILIFSLSLTFLYAGCTKNETLPEISSDNSSISNSEIITLPSGIKVTKMDSLYLFQGDIILSDYQLELLSLPDTKSAIVSNFVSHWPSGIVYYAIDVNLPSEIKTMVNSAIAEFESKTYIRFYPKTSLINDYVLIKGYTPPPGIQGSSSHLGKKQGGGQQTISLTTNYVPTSGYDILRRDILHEIGHTVGLLHEHNRSDRDQYIEFIPANMSITLQDPSLQIFDGYNGQNIGPFDFESVMIYDSWAFSSGSGLLVPPSMIKKGYAPNDPNGRFMGGYQLSAGDIAGLKEIYSRSFYTTPTILIGPPVNGPPLYHAPVGSTITYYQPEIKPRVISKIWDVDGKKYSVTHNPDGSISVTFNQAGIYQIYCYLYAEGNIQVAAFWHETLIL